MADAIGPFGDVAGGGDLVDAALQRVEVALARRGCADDEDDGHAIEIGVGERGVGIGETGAGGEHRDADLAGRARIGFRGVAGRGFVPRVGQADAMVAACDQESVEVAAMEREDFFDACDLQCAGDQRAPGDLVHPIRSFGSEWRSGRGRAFSAAFTVSRALPDSSAIITVDIQ